MVLTDRLSNTHATGLCWTNYPSPPSPWGGVHLLQEWCVADSLVLTNQGTGSFSLSVSLSLNLCLFFFLSLPPSIPLSCFTLCSTLLSLLVQCSVSITSQPELTMQSCVLVLHVAPVFSYTHTHPVSLSCSDMEEHSQHWANQIAVSGLLELSAKVGFSH